MIIMEKIRHIPSVLTYGSHIPFSLRITHTKSTVSANNELFADTVSANNELFADTVSANNFYLNLINF